MDADRPIKRVKDDRLGFAPIAKQLAQSILDHGAKDGLVFGVEGRWGSGRSTLINLTIASLSNATSVNGQPISFAFSHDSPCNAGHFMSNRHSDELGWFLRQEPHDPEMLFGKTSRMLDNRRRASDEQSSKMAISLFGNSA